MKNRRSQGSVRTYIIIAVVLAIITYIEYSLVEYNVPLGSSAIYFWLFTLSIVKFLLVIMFFMHLKGDPSMFSGVFGSGMVLAMGTVGALLLIFSALNATSVARADSDTEVSHSASQAHHGEIVTEDQRSLAERLRRPPPKDSSVNLRRQAGIADARGNPIANYDPAPMAARNDQGYTPRLSERIGEVTQDAHQGVARYVEVAPPSSSAPAPTITIPAPVAAAPAAPAPAAPATPMAAAPATPAVADFDWQALGASTYSANCASCHQGNGAGIPGAFPALAGHIPTVFNADGGHDYLINVLLYGLMGAIEANGMNYNGVMPAWAHLSDEQVAAVLNHIIHAWDNDALLARDHVFTPAEIAAERNQGLNGQQVHNLRDALF